MSHRLNEGLARLLQFEELALRGLKDVSSAPGTPPLEKESLADIALHHRVGSLTSKLKGHDTADLVSVNLVSIRSGFKQRHYT